MNPIKVKRVDDHRELWWVSTVSFEEKDFAVVIDPSGDIGCYELGKLKVDMEAFSVHIHQPGLPSRIVNIPKTREVFTADDEEAEPPF